MKKQHGFTLAEVLITLGIIGVVAAMTMPTLMSNTQGAQFKTAFKKELSTLNQAVLMQFAMEDTDLSNLVADTATTPTTTSTGNGITMAGILASRLQAATNITSNYYSANGIGTAGVALTNMSHACTAADITGAAAITECAGKTAGDVVTKAAATLNSSNSFVYSFADGTSFGWNKNAANCTTATSANCYGFLDVNGSTKPNQITNCANAANNRCEASEIHDIYPVVFYGQTVEAATASGRAILTNK